MKPCKLQPIMENSVQENICVDLGISETEMRSISSNTPVTKTTKKGQKSSHHLVPDSDLGCTDINVEETPLTSKGTVLQTYTGLRD